MMEYNIGEKIIDNKSLTKFLLDHDSDFYPTLSYRVNIKKYATKIHKKAILIIVKNVNNGKIVGVTAFYANDHIYKTAYLSIIIVDFDYSGKGVAKQMLELLNKYLIKKNYREISLEVYKENKAAIKLYEKEGYRTMRKDNDYIQMTKQF